MRRVFGNGESAGEKLRLLLEPDEVGELRSQRGRLVAHHQRYAGIAQRVEAGADRQPRRDVESLVARGIDGELLHHVERCVPAGELDHLRRVVDGLEHRAAGFLLDKARDVHVGHAPLRGLG